MLRIYIAWYGEMNGREYNDYLLSILKFGIDIPLKSHLLQKNSVSGAPGRVDASFASITGLPGLFFCS